MLIFDAGTETNLQSGIGVLGFNCRLLRVVAQCRAWSSSPFDRPAILSAEGLAKCLVQADPAGDHQAMWLPCRRLLYLAFSNKFFLTELQGPLRPLERTDLPTGLRHSWPATGVWAMRIHTCGAANRKEQLWGWAPMPRHPDANSERWPLLKPCMQWGCRSERSSNVSGTGRWRAWYSEGTDRWTRQLHNPLFCVQMAPGSRGL